MEQRAIDRLAFVWDSFGPYHLARVAEVRKSMAHCQVIGIEISDANSTYAWQVQDRNVVSLFRGKNVEKVSPLQVFWKLFRFFQKEKPAVAFLPGYWPLRSVACMAAARAAGVRMVMMCDSHDGTNKASGWKGRIKEWLITRYDTGLVAGSRHVSFFSRLGLPKERLLTGYDVVDNGFYARAQQLGEKNPKRMRLLSVSRHVEKKALHLLVEAVRRLVREEGLLVQLVFVGDGPLNASLREQCQSGGLDLREIKGLELPADGDVCFCGFRQADENLHFYGAADVFVIPSSEEEWGLVVNEAMAAGLPVVASDAVGCVPDLVRDGETGLVFEAGDIDDLTDKLRSLAMDTQMRARLANKARRHMDDWGLGHFAGSVGKLVEICAR